MMHLLIAVSLIVAAACGGSKPPDASKSADNSVAVAVVMSGLEIWVGNDRVLPADDPARYVGALDYVKAGLDGAQLGKLPAGSLGTLIVYDKGARVKLAMGPVAKLNSEAIGGQKDYMGTATNDMVAGVELGLKELTNTKAGRKVMIVLGDGNDTNRDTANARLANLHQQAMAEKIELHAVVYKTELSDKETPITELVPDTVVAKSIDDVKAQLTAKLEKLHP